MTAGLRRDWRNDSGDDEGTTLRGRRRRNAGAASKYSDPALSDDDVPLARRRRDLGGTGDRGRRSGPGTSRSTAARCRRPAGGAPPVGAVHVDEAPAAALPRL